MLSYSTESYLIKFKQRLKKTNVAIFTWLYLHGKWLLSHFVILVVEIFEVLLKGPFFPLHQSPLQNFTLRLWLVSFNRSRADLEQRENIHLNCYLHTSLWYLKSFMKAFKDLLVLKFYGNVQFSQIISQFARNSEDSKVPQQELR